MRSPSPRSVYRACVSLPGLRQLNHSERAQRWRRAVRQSLLVRESSRYLVAALVEAPGVHGYTSRWTGRQVWLRHPGDSWTFEELFRARVYDLPEAVENALGPSPTVVDLGANIGLFGAAILADHPNARVIGFEPDPGNLAICDRNLASAVADGRYELVRAAAGTAPGEATFTVGLGGSSHAGSDAGGVHLDVEVRDVLPLLQRADLAKIDIEGGEWEILRDPRFGDAGPRAVALEFHGPGDAAQRPDEEARTLLQQAGYRTVEPRRPFAADEFPEGQGMLWALRDG